jgi:hypothetical protein
MVADTPQGVDLWGVEYEYPVSGEKPQSVSSGGVARRCPCLLVNKSAFVVHIRHLYPGLPKIGPVRL